MDVYTVYTESHKSLFEKFSRSLPLSVRLFAKSIDNPGGDFGSSEFTKTVYEKVHFLRDVIRDFQLLRSNDQNRIIVYCDVDIIFIRDCETEVIAALKDADMAFQDNLSESNVGFWAIKCNPASLAFFDELCAQPEESFQGRSHDQSVVNDLLPKFEGRLKHVRLGREFWAIHFDNDSWCKSYPDNIAICHMTNRRLNQKMGEMNAFIQSFRIPELKTQLEERLNNTSEIINYYGTQSIHEEFKIEATAVILPSKRLSQKTGKNMKIEEIHIGDVVYLVSGGPKLTIEDFKPSVMSNQLSTTQVKVIWISQDGLLQALWLPMECLTIVNPQI